MSGIARCARLGPRGRARAGHAFGFGQSHRAGSGNALAEQGIFLDRPGHIAGFCLLGLAAVGLIVVFSLKKPPDDRFPPPDERFPPPRDERFAPRV